MLATARAVQALGAELRRDNGVIDVVGQGVGGLQAPATDLDFGNSGTGSRLMFGVAAGHDWQARFTGDASLKRRPMARVLAPLERMGLSFAGDGKAHAAADRQGHARSPAHPSTRRRSPRRR